MSYDREPVEATVADLRPRMKSLNITFKVVEKGEEREVTSRRDGETHRVLDAVAGDSTGTVVLSLWDDMIDTVDAEKSYRLENGYTSLFQGHLRLNIGRYGELKDAETEVDEIDMDNDLSAAEHERPPRRSYGGYSRRSYGGGGGGRDYRRGGGGSRRGSRDRGRSRY
ncbi:MAG: single-stranded DNA-binding protein [Candidatus Thorarchaeota archaeon]